MKPQVHATTTAEVSPKPPASRAAWELVFERARAAPESIALAAPDRRPLSFGDLERHVRSLAAALNALGIGRADPVALVLPNGPEMAAALLAVMSCATCVPLNPACTAEDFDFFLGQSRARALIVDAGSDSPAVAVARRRGVRVIELALTPGATAGSLTINGSDGSGSGGTPDLARANDIAVILHTSGTTARAKAVPLTHANLCASARQIATTLQLSPDDRCLNIMPLFHVHGLATVLAALAAGGSVACTPGLVGGRFFDWVQSLRPSWYTAVPAMHQAVLVAAEARSESIRDNPLRFIRSSSAPLPPRMMANLERCFGSPVVEAYGMTEAAHQIASNPLPPAHRKPGSVGLAAGPEVAIMNGAGEVLPRGERGEIVIRGPSVVAGYLVDPEGDRRAFAHGWFHTGDQGWLDGDGYLFMTGRLNELINRGGEKISPREIEAAIESHPAVQAAAAFGIPHPTLGEEIVAAVVKEPGAAIEGSPLVDRVRQRMGPTRVPRRIYFVDQLPRTESGKVRRSDLPRLLAPGYPDPSAGRQPVAAQRGAANSPLEVALAGLWMSVLPVSAVDREDDFFLLGGDSLQGARLLTSVKAVFGVELTMQALFGEAATVAGMARAIEKARSAYAPTGGG